MIRNVRQWIGATIAAIVLLGVGVAIGVASAPTPAPKVITKAIAPACQPDPTASIDATPAGTTWPGSGCFNVPNGITIPSGINLANVVFVDPSTAVPVKGSFKPIVTLFYDTGNTLTNVTVEGANTTGKYNPTLVNEAGFKLIGTTNITMTNVTASDTFGDCLEIWAIPPKYRAPNTGLVVNGLHANNCGRIGITPSDVYGATMNDAVIGHTGLASIDFESDLKGLGAGNVVFNRGSWNGTIVQERLTGPVTFNDPTLGSHIEVTLHNPQPYPIAFVGGSLNGSNGQAPVILRGQGSLTFTGFTFTRQPAKQPPPLWNVSKGGKLTLSHSTLAAPLGTPEAGVKQADGSLVTVTP